MVYLGLQGKGLVTDITLSSGMGFILIVRYHPERTDASHRN